jgi:predicted dehydrogenase
LAGEEPDGLPTFADGLRAARLTQAVLDSAGKHAWVEVPL